MSDLRESFDCVGPGWKPILESLDFMFDRVTNDVGVGLDLKILQVKEKFGGLRVYISLDLGTSGCTDAHLDTARKRIQDLALFAEGVSFNTCEVCGRAGNAAPGGVGWVKTMCKEHHSEWEVTGESPLGRFWKKRNEKKQVMRPRG